MNKRKKYRLDEQFRCWNRSGRKGNNACYTSPDGEIKKGFKFPMNRDVYTKFRKKISLET